MNGWKSTKSHKQSLKELHPAYSCLSNYMPKRTCGYIPLPMPKTSKKKWCMYIHLDGILEMILFDGIKCYTPDFPDIPIERIELEDNRYITHDSLSRVCKKLMKEMKITYNRQFKIWEAIPINQDELPF